MGHIFYILGKSGVGKDTIYNEIKKNMGAHMREVVPYTTRPMRAGEADGADYHFVTEAEYQKLHDDKKIIEERCYNTVHGPWRYFTAYDSQVKDVKSGDGKYLMIGVLEAYVSVRDYFGSDYVTPLYIDLDDGIRLQRALDREKKQTEPKYKEMCRRYIADSEDFAEDKLEAAGINRRIINDDLKRCVEECLEIIVK